MWIVACRLVEIKARDVTWGDSEGEESKLERCFEEWVASELVYRTEEEEGERAFVDKEEETKESGNKEQES